MDDIPPEYSRDRENLPVRAGVLLEQVRRDAPRVHALTNAAAQVFTANLLLAAGAIPSLTIAEEEVEAFAGRAAALLVNLGTLDASRRTAYPCAIAAAQAQKKPWVLDPVFVEASPPRLAFAQSLLAQSPTVLRCNAGEFQALARQEPSPGNLQAFAKDHHIVMALTGATDLICDRSRRIAVHNGHPLMAKTTAMGCAGTALIAAFTAVTPDVVEAAAAALLILGVTGEIAAERAGGPGSFPSSFLDALYHLSPETLLKRARLS